MRSDTNPQMMCWISLLLRFYLRNSNEWIMFLLQTQYCSSTWCLYVLVALIVLMMFSSVMVYYIVRLNVHAFVDICYWCDCVCTVTIFVCDGTSCSLLSLYLLSHSLNVFTEILAGACHDLTSSCVDYGELLSSRNSSVYFLSMSLACGCC